VRQLEALEAVAALGLFAYDIEDRVDEFSALGVMTLGPIVTGARLPEYKIVGTEDLAKWTGSYRIHCTRLEIHEDGPGYIFAARGLIVVNVDPLELEVAVAVVGTSRVDAMFVADDFPKLQAN
jgi:proteasome assembly chaperone (PAC2) family protein